MQNNLHLIINSIDPSNNFLILSTDSEELRLPVLGLNQIDINNNTLLIDDLVRNMFKQYVSLDPNWNKPRFIDIDLIQTDSQEKYLLLFYSCSIPYKSVLKNSHWHDATELLKTSTILRKAIYAY